MQRKIKIPEGVEVRIEGKKVFVKGQKGEIARNFSNPAFNRHIIMAKDGSEITISSDDERRKIKAMVGTINALLNKMITGVTRGYKYTLKIYFVHFPVSVESKEMPAGIDVSVKNFLGEKKPRKALLRGVKMKVAGDIITLTGVDSEKVGQAAARLEQITKVRKKDRRIFNDGIFPMKHEIDG